MLKQLISLTLLNCAVFSFAFSQTPTAAANNSSNITTTEKATTAVEIPNETYELMLDNYLRVKFREYAYTNLNLTSKEIIALDPIYMAYMKEKNELNDRRRELMADYREEMKEDDRAKDEAEESAEFIEDYWEINIDAQRLRKEYFDRMEDAIPYQKAFSFFLIEESLENRVSQERTYEFIPVLIDLDNSEITFYREQNRFNVWMKNNNVDINGLVSLDHQYTYDGLKQLTRSIEATVDVVNGYIPDLQKNLDMIMEKATGMQQDAYADTHADMARQAFLMVVDVLEDVKALDGVVVSQANIDAMRKAAKNIDPKKLYMDQSEHAYMFFTQAQETINNIYSKQTTSMSQMPKSTSSANEK